MLLLAHKAYHEISLKYLTELINKREKSHSIQFVDDILLNIPKIKEVNIVIMQLSWTLI